MNLSASEVRAEAAFLVLEQYIALLPEKMRRELSRRSHDAARGLGVIAIEEETCGVLGCPPEHSLEREDRLLALLQPGARQAQGAAGKPQGPSRLRQSDQAKRPRRG